MHLTLTIKKNSLYKVFFFFLIFFSIFRERISIPIWPYYIKLLESYIAITIPLSLFIFVKERRSFFTKSSALIIILFSSFFVSNYLASQIIPKYALIGEYVSSMGTGTRFSGPPIEHEDIIYYFRLGLLFFVSMVVLIGLTANYPLLIRSVYLAFIVAGFAIPLWSLIFPSYTKTISPTESNKLYPRVQLEDR